MSHLSAEDFEHIRLITINRPEVRNALSSDLVKKLSELCDELKNDNLIRVVVFVGEGDKAFSAGADLKERQGMSEMATLDFVRNIQSTLQKIAELPMPTIAAINGDAFGGGLELALACDVRVMSKSATIGLTECSLGIIPGAGGTQRLPRLIGLSSAMDLIFSARRIDALEALSLKLVNFLANDASHTRLMAMDLAKKIAKNAPLAVRAAKEALVSAQEKSLKEGLVIELASYHEILDSADRKEGLKAFSEKRAPHFRGA